MVYLLKHSSFGFFALVTQQPSPDPLRFALAHKLVLMLELKVLVGIIESPQDDFSHFQKLLVSFSTIQFIS